MKQKIKLAAIDLDGTLLGPDKLIAPENLAALRQLEAEGMEILIATGRHYTRITDYLAHVANARWAVTCQGASVIDLDSGKACLSVTLTPAETHLLVALGKSLGFSSVVYAEDCVRALQFDDMVHFYGSISGGPALATDMEEFSSLRAHKVVWLGKEDSIVKLPELKEINGLPLYHVQTHENIYEFLPSEASKALGVSAVADSLNIGPEEIVAFGDGDNDVPLFRWAGKSFAMHHGTRTARESGSDIAPAGPPETAFARAVEQLLTCTILN